MDHLRWYAAQKGTSASPSKGDMCDATKDVRFGSKADICTARAPCPLYPQKRTFAVQQPMSALGQQRTSANKLRNLFFMGRAANPSTLRQWPCRDWAGDRSRPPREDAIAPPRQGRASAGVQGNLPWNAATTGHYLRLILSRSLGGSYMGTRSAQGTFVANLPL